MTIYALSPELFSEVTTALNDRAFLGTYQRARSTAAETKRRPFLVIGFIDKVGEERRLWYWPSLDRSLWLNSKGEPVSCCQNNCLLYKLFEFPALPTRPLYSVLIFPTFWRKPNTIALFSLTALLYDPFSIQQDHKKPKWTCYKASLIR